MERVLQLLLPIWLLAVMSATTSAQTESPVDAVVRPIHRWTNIVAGEEVSVDFRMPDTVSSGTTIGWSVFLENAVIRRSESMVRDDSKSGRLLTISFKVPEGDSRTQLTISVFVSVNGQDIRAAEFFVYPTDPFRQRIDLPESEKLIVFDPSGNTAARLKSSNISFRAERRVDALNDLQEGIIIVGEGTSFRQYRGLGPILRAAASRGVRVLCLSPAAGAIPLSEPVKSASASVKESEGDGSSIQKPDESGGSPQDVAALRKLECRQSDVLHDFDRHLDAFAWRGVSSMSDTSLQITGKSGSTSMEFSDTPGGWLWVDAEYVGGGRIVCTSLQMIRHWESGPGPRHAFWNCLSRIATPQARSVAKNHQK